MRAHLPDFRTDDEQASAAVTTRHPPHLVMVLSDEVNGQVQVVHGGRAAPRIR